MTLTSLPGGLLMPLGPFPWLISNTTPGLFGTTMNALNEAQIIVGHVVTADGGSHTIDTTGSSSLQWLSGTVTFANAGTTVKVGLAAVDTANGPPARAANASDVISFDVSKSLTGGGGGITANAWQSHVPDAGSKTIANGDLVAFAVQMTARGGADSVQQSFVNAHATGGYPTATQFVGSYVANSAGAPTAIIVFSDGTLGWFYGSEVATAISSRLVDSGDTPNEYGQLYQMPFPCRVHGLYGFVKVEASFDMVLYSDPLGTPAAEKTVSVDENVFQTNQARRIQVLFPSPYDAAADEALVVAMKPSTMTPTGIYYKTINNAAHRVTDPWGTDGYGVSRSAGAFANANSSLEHYYLGLLVGGFDDAAAGGGRAMLVNEATLVD